MSLNADSILALQTAKIEEGKCRARYDAFTRVAHE